MINVKYPCFTQYSNGIKRVIDHIYYNEKVELVSLLDTPTEEDIARDGDLPNKRFPSDHIRLQTKFLVHF